MCYVVDDNRFECKLTYPDRLMDYEDEHDRRKKAIKEYFGDIWVDYPRKVSDDGPGR